MAWVSIGTLSLNNADWKFSANMPKESQAIKISQSCFLGGTPVPPENLKGLRALLALTESIGGIRNYASFKRIYPSNNANVIRIFNATFNSPAIALRITRDRWLHKWNLSWNFSLEYWDLPLIDSQTEATLIEQEIIQSIGGIGGGDIPPTLV